MRRALSLVLACALLIALLGATRGQAAPSGCAIRALVTEPDGGQVERWVPQPAAACAPGGLAAASPGTPGTPGTPGPAPTATATATAPPPTATPTVPPTATATPEPPTATPAPPTATAVPPTATPVPSPTPGPSPSPGATVVVPDQYPTVAAAVTAAGDNGTIRLRAGTYREQVNPRSGQTLEAFGDGTPWLDGECLRSYGIEALGTNLTVRGLGVKRTLSAAITMRGNRAGGLVVENSTLQDFNCNNVDSHSAAGILYYYTMQGPARITDNTIVYRVELPGVPVDYGSGLYFKSNTANPSGGGHYIAGNLIVGTWDGLGGAENGSSRGGYDRDFLIERNTIRDCDDNGMEIEGGTLNGIVRDNDIAGCPSGIGLAGIVAPGPLLVERNHITGTTPRVGSGGADCFKVGASAATAGPVYLTDNVCVLGGIDPATGARFGDGIKQTNAGLAPIVSRGNTFSVQRYVFEFTGTPPGSSFDGDCLWTTDPARTIKWQNHAYTTFEAWRVATGQEPGGRFDAACGQ